MKGGGGEVRDYGDSEGGRFMGGEQGGVRGMGV